MLIRYYSCVLAIEARLALGQLTQAMYVLLYKVDTLILFITCLSKYPLHTLQQRPVSASIYAELE